MCKIVQGQVHVIFCGVPDCSRSRANGLSFMKQRMWAFVVSGNRLSAGRNIDTSLLL